MLVMLMKKMEHGMANPKIETLHDHDEWQRDVRCMKRVILLGYRTCDNAGLTIWTVLPNCDDVCESIPQTKPNRRNTK